MLAERWAKAAYDLFTRQKPGHHAHHGVQYLLTDKGFHVTLFCILALLLCQALKQGGRQWWIILGSGAVIGSISEYLQSFFPGRDPAIKDVLINIGGTELGLVVNQFIFRDRKRFTLKR